RVSRVGAVRGPRLRPRIASLPWLPRGRARRHRPPATVRAHSAKRSGHGRLTLHRTAEPCRSARPCHGLRWQRPPPPVRRFGARWGSLPLASPRLARPLVARMVPTMRPDVISSPVPQISLASRRLLRYRARQRGAGPRRGRPMTLGLPVLWRRYLSELSIERAVADRTRCAYETGWNSFVTTARSMGWRLKVADDITYERLMEG